MDVFTINRSNAYLVESVISLNVEGLVGRRRGSQKKIISEFKAKIPCDSFI